MAIFKIFGGRGSSVIWVGGGGGGGNSPISPSKLSPDTSDVYIATYMVHDYFLNISTSHADAIIMLRLIKL